MKVQFGWMAVVDHKRQASLGRIGSMGVDDCDKRRHGKGYL